MELIVNGLSAKPISRRGKDWLIFAAKVLHHIESYTVPQYGDKGSDQCTEFELPEYASSIKRYANRMGRNQREGHDLLDMLKTAHYAQMAHDHIDRLSDTKE